MSNTRINQGEEEIKIEENTLELSVGLHRGRVNQ